MMDEDIDIAEDAEERESPLHSAARELIGCAQDWIDDCGNEANTRDAIARLETILKEMP